MELSPDVLHGLSLLGESRNRITDDDLQKILQTVTRSLVWRVGDEKETGSDMRTGEHKLICLSLMSILLAAARLNNGLEKEWMRISDVLSDCEVSKERIQLIHDVYQRERERMQQRLAALSLGINPAAAVSLPAFRDVKWTQEIILKSSQLERMQSPLIHYLISVRHEAGSLDFAADVDDLQELVHSLKECCKAIDAVKRKQ